MLALFFTCNDFVAYTAMLFVECPVTTIDASLDQFVH
jgi:hypothetical protein